MFEPEPPFDRVEPILGALQRAMLEFETDAPLPPPDELAAMPRAAQVRLIRATLGDHSVVRRLVESQRAVDAFALHLRDERDREVPTEFIAIHRLPADGAPDGTVESPTPDRQANPHYVIVTRMEASSDA